MAYLPLNNLVLKSNYQAKDLNIVAFNATMATLQVFLNTLRTNVAYLKALSDAYGTELNDVGDKLTYGLTGPENPTLNSIWIDSNG